MWLKLFLLKFDEDGSSASCDILNLGMLYSLKNPAIVCYKLHKIRLINHQLIDQYFNIDKCFTDVEIMK